MCGLIWAKGPESEVLAPKALKGMQYRGYDSFGFACLTAQGIEGIRSLDDLRSFEEPLPESEMVLGHTRWATHGGVSLENCHPHWDEPRRFALVHNGMLENYDQLAEDSGHTGDSDTRLLAELLSSFLDEGADNIQAFEHLVNQIEGRNTLVCMFSNGEVCAYRWGSPLLLVKLASGCALTSDIGALGSSANQFVALEDGDIVHLLPGQDIAGQDIAGQDDAIVSNLGAEKSLIWQRVSEPTEAMAATYEMDGPGMFMAEEIFDQWRTIPLFASPRVGSEQLIELLRVHDSVLVTGAGGAYLVADQIARFLQTQAGYKSHAVSSCEFDRMKCFSSGSVLLAISQSGETADTLEAIKRAKEWGMPVVSLVNMPHSTMARVSDLSIPLGIGPEYCVLSTKSASAQIAFGYWLSNALAGHSTSVGQVLNSLGRQLSQHLTKGLMSQFEPALDYLCDQASVYLLGRGDDHIAATLGALNLKEASYIHAEAFSAGELKHGVLALIEEGVPVILFGVGRDPYMSGVLSELKSRGAVTITVDSSEGDLFLPDPSSGMPVGNIITCQLLAYWLALRRGVDPDRPRNLAKSVTVL